MECVVLRRFKTDHMLEAGEVVDVSAWRPRNVEGLIEGRYLRPVVADSLAGYQIHLTREAGKASAATRKKEGSHG
jgi:hypothetical protein